MPTLTEKILAAHLTDGEMKPGNEIGLRIDQTLTQDSTGTMAYLELEAMGIDRVKTERSVAYIDHNMLQSGPENLTTISSSRALPKTSASPTAAQATASATRCIWKTSASQVKP